MDELARVLLNVIGELLLGLVLRHGPGAQRFFLLFTDGPARGVRDVEMEKADPDLAFAWPVNLLDPSLRSLASSQFLWLWRAADVANADLNDGSECGARIRGAVGRRSRRGGMHGCVLRHARSIGTNGFGRNFATGWAVGWAVCPATTCKLLKDLVGASGFEPPTSWSRTRRSTRLSHAPNTSDSDSSLRHSQLNRLQAAHKRVPSNS